MSLTKRFMTLEEERVALRASLKSLLDREVLTHPASVGIAKKLINDGNLDGLSPMQKEIFSSFIAPKLDRTCERCGAKIHVACYPEVLSNVQFEGLVLCEECLYIKGQMQQD